MQEMQVSRSKRGGTRFNRCFVTKTATKVFLVIWTLCTMKGIKRIKLAWTRSLLMLWPLQDHGSVLAICNADCNHCASVHRQPFSACWRHPVLSPPYQWASLSCEPCLSPILPLFVCHFLMPGSRKRLAISSLSNQLGNL